MPTLKTHSINNKIQLSLKNNTLHAIYQSCTIDLELAKKIVKERSEFTNNQCMPAIITCKGRIEITKDARKYFSSLKGTLGLSYIALVYENSISNKLLMNFMLKMHPPIVPTKIFKSKEKAISWIETKTLTSLNKT